MTLGDCLNFILPDFVRHFIDFYSNRTGLFRVYYYISSFFWIFFFASVGIITVALFYGDYHRKRMIRTRKKKYARDLQKVIKIIKKRSEEDF